MLNYRRTTQFKKDYKQQIRRGKDNNKIDAIISDLINERPLDAGFKRPSFERRLAGLPGVAH